MADRDLWHDNPKPYRPERALLWGVVCGFVAVLFCLLWVLFSGQYLNALTAWIMPLIGAAAASYVAAHKKGSTLGRSFSVSVFASIITFSFSMLADYFYLLISVTGPDLPQDIGSPLGLLKVKLATSILAVILGAAFGLLLGKRKYYHEPSYPLEIE